MAVAFESVATAAAGANNITIGKPTGLAAGDLMVAHLAASDSAAGAIDQWGSPGGTWTSLVTISSAPGAMTHRVEVFYKYADAGDAAAADFTFTGDADSDAQLGAIYRISGAALAPTGAIDAEPTTDTTPTYTNTVTPSYINSLMLFLVSSGGDLSTQSVSGYAITTNNPTWTERYDLNQAGSTDGDVSLAGATASRPEATATGNSDCTLAEAPSTSVGVMVACYPLVSVTVSPAVVDATATINAPTVTGGAAVSPAVVVVTPTINAATVTTAAPKWANTDKSSAPTWTNPDKS